MSQEFWKVDEIEVTVSGFFTTHHTFSTAEGVWGEMTFPAFDRSAVFERADGHRLEMRRTRWWSGDYELLDGEVVRGTADRQRLLNRDLVVQFGGQEYRLLPEGAFKMGWFLTGAEGSRLVEVQPRGAFKQGAHITLGGWLDPDLVMFAYYLVHMRKQEEAAAVAATS